MRRYAIGMVPDRELESGIRSIWTDLRGMGISSNLLDDKGRPHLSLAVCEGLADGFEEQLEMYSLGLGPFELSLEAAGTFGLEAGVVFLAPAATFELTRLHQDFHASFEESLQSCSSLYLPGSWVPHCTVAMGLAPEEICRAIAVCAGSRLPLRGRLVSIAMMEFCRESVLSCRTFDMGSGAGPDTKGPAGRR